MRELRENRQRQLVIFEKRAKGFKERGYKGEKRVSHFSGKEPAVLASKE